MAEEFQPFSFYQLFRQVRHIRWGAALEVMTEAEFMALAAIRTQQEAAPERPGVYVSALAEHLTISVSMASKMLRGLEEKGWILRTVDPQSRRNTFVAMTPEGGKLFEAENARITEASSHVMEKMGRERMERLIADVSLLAQYYAEETKK